MLEGPRGPTALVLEIDRGTTAPKRLVDKFAGYLAWKTDGGPLRDFHTKALRVVTIVPDERRRAALHAAALAANGNRRSGFLLFAKAEEITAGRPTGFAGLLLGASAGTL